MKNTLNRIFKIISSAIFVILVIIIIVILAYVIRVKYLASQNRLGEVNVNFYTILTQSMVPTIDAGDVVVCTKNKDNKYKNGDIITYSSDLNGGINITHRIKESYVVNNKYSYKTKGDNNSTADSQIVKGERVLGKVVLRIPKVGFFQQYLVQKHRWIAIIVIPCLGVIIYDVLQMVKGMRKKEDEEGIDEPSIGDSPDDTTENQENEKDKKESKELEEKDNKKENKDNVEIL